MTDPTLPRYVLRHTNAYGEWHYFVRLGHRWDEDPKWQGLPDPKNRRLIRETTKDRDKATVFDTLPDALAPIVEAGDPPGWQVMTTDGKIVE